MSCKRSLRKYRGHYFYILEAKMSVAEIYENRATFSFEVFPPKTDVGMEKL